MSLHLERYLPDPPLTAFIRFYYSITTEASADPFAFTNHPQGSMDLVFLLQGRAGMQGTTKELTWFEKIFAVGLKYDHFTFHFEPGTKVFGVVFEAESYRRLFNFPMNEIAHQGIDVTDELQREFGPIHEQLALARNDNENCKLLNNFFTSQLSLFDSGPDSVEQIIKHIRQQKGLISVSKLADEANMSIRTLQRHIKDRLGISPKSYSRIARFNYAMSLLQEHPNYDWQDILYQCGYFDQMHFIKDFRKFTGQTPAKFLESELPLVDLFRDKDAK